MLKLKCTKCKRNRSMTASHAKKVEGLKYSFKIVGRATVYFGKNLLFIQ